MKLFARISSFLLFVLSVSFSAGAQELAGGSITYKCLGNNVYQITVQLYGKCPYAVLPQPSISVSYYSPSINQTPAKGTLIQVGSDQTIVACPGNASACNGGTGENASAITVRTYTGNITLNQKLSDWVVETQQNTRTALNTSPLPLKNMYLGATINNTVIGCNNSTTFNSLPSFFPTTAQNTVIDPGLINPDGDKLQVSLIAPKVSPNTNISYNAPYSATQPISSTGAFTIDPNTGKVTFTSSTQGETSSMAIQVKEYDKNGVLVGSVMRETYLQTLSPQTSPPYFVSPDSLKFCANSGINIRYTGLTNATNTPLDIIWNNKADWGMSAADSGRSFYVAKGPGSATFVLNTSSSSTFTRRLDLTLLDNKCGKVNKSVVVVVNPQPKVLRNSADSTVLCLKPFQLTINPIGGVAPYSYIWNDTTQKTNSILVTSAGTYSVLVSDVNHCKVTWSKTIKSPINFTRGRISCVDSTITFYDISGTFPSYLPPPARPLAGTAEWTWDFGDGATAKTSVPSATHHFASTGTYKVTMGVSDGKGCNNSIIKDFKIYGKPNVGFSMVDSCVSTERSDLKVQDQVNGGDTTVQDNNILYYVDGSFRTNAFKNRNPTKLFASQPGTYVVRQKVTNDAGCVNEYTKTLKVRNRPYIDPMTSYYYRCDLPGFPDTVLTFHVNAKDDALIKSNLLSLDIQRSFKPDSLLPSYVSGSPLAVPVHVIQNKTNFVKLLAQDAYGCTNDTTIDIIDPINPIIQLEKYYCFLNDTLKLSDYTFEQKNYHWGLGKANWDMKDGQVDTTLGFVNHVYTLSAKSLDQADIVLYAIDKTGCADSSKPLPVYLSEPDTNQFSIVKPLACYADTVHIYGIKDKYINSWYYRYQNSPDSIYIKPDQYIYHGDPAFGQTIPSYVDTIQFFTSSRYETTTGIFYNEPDTSQNFQKLTSGKNIYPLQPAKVCHLEVSRPWRIVERLHFTLSNNYDHCFDSTKIFNAELMQSFPNMKLDTTSWKWSLYTPDNTLIDTTRATLQTGLVYQPDTSLFRIPATTRPSYNSSGQFLPYTIKVKYQYTNDTIVCSDTTSLKVANELVTIQIDTTPNVTCLNYTRSFYFATERFLRTIQINDSLTISEWDSTLWEFGDGTSEKGYLLRRRYEKPGLYQIIAHAKNYYGCTAKDTMILRVKPSPIADLRVDTVCYGLRNVLDASHSKPADSSSSIVDYYWYFSDKIWKQSDNPAGQPAIPGDTTEPWIDRATLITTAPVIDTILSVGDHSVGIVVKDADGCYDETEIKVAVVNPLPSVDFTATAKLTNDQDYLGNEPIVFDPTSKNVFKFTWKMGDGKSVIASDTSGIIEYTYPYYTVPPHPLSDNIYNVTLVVTTIAGCLDSVSKPIDVNAYFVLPNAFSPNDDGLHDQLLGVGKGIKEIKEFKIFNRWGEVIYSVTGKPDKDALKRGYLLWDGVYNGQVQPVGAYVYYAVVTTGYGDEIIRKGNLTLMK
jgi:gliding motility-associated-like protein